MEGHNNDTEPIPDAFLDINQSSDQQLIGRNEPFRAINDNTARGYGLEGIPSSDYNPITNSNTILPTFYDNSPSEDSPLLDDVNGDLTPDGGMSIIYQGLDHCHASSPSKKSWQAITRLLIACGLTTAFLIAEAVGGYLANSISIMSDAAHLLGDLTSFIVSLVAIYLALRPASKKMSFGYQRAEVLGAVISVLIIWLITGILVYVAVQRVISMDFEIEADIMIIVSAIGVAINIILGCVLHGGPGHGHSHGSGSSTDAAPERSNINIRAAMIHVLGDLVQSVGVLISAYIIKYVPEWKIADPICTFVFSVIVVITTVPILKDLAIVLMEGTPPGIDFNQVLANLTSIPGVAMVHSLHVWALTLNKNACSVHLAINSGIDPDGVLKAAQRVIRYKHNIFQTTIQVEKYQPQLMENCQQCQPLC